MTNLTDEQIDAVIDIWFDYADGPPEDWTGRMRRALDKAASFERCQYCDGTGDVHSIDGEWRGECTACDANKEPK
jgi:hypothetical protein